MSKKAVIVCSNAGLDYLDHPKDITIFRSKIHFGNEMFDDYTQMNGSAFYQRIASNADDIPKTSYVSIGFMLETFDRLLTEGYDEALVIVIARPLSGLHDAILNLEKQTNLKLRVYDSKTLTYPESYMALTAYQMFAEGKQMDEVLEVLDFIRDNHKIYFGVDTLLYLVKNGRLSKLQGTIGTVLKIKPVLTISKEGRVETLEKIRTAPKALRRIVDLYLKDTKGKEVVTFVSHAENDAVVEEIRKMIHRIYPNREVISTYLTPVVGAHAGPKAYGLGYIMKK